VAELAEELGGSSLEYESKAESSSRQARRPRRLAKLTVEQRNAGIDAITSRGRTCSTSSRTGSRCDVRRFLSSGQPGSAMLATAQLLRRAVSGATVLTNTEVVGFVRAPRRCAQRVRTTSSSMPTVHAKWVVNAAGTWSGSGRPGRGGCPDPARKASFWSPNRYRGSFATRCTPPSTSRTSPAATRTADLGGGRRTRAGTVLIGASGNGSGRPFRFPASAGDARAQAIAVFPSCPRWPYCAATLVFARTAPTTSQ